MLRAGAVGPLLPRPVDTDQHGLASAISLAVNTICPIARVSSPPDRSRSASLSRPAPRRLRFPRNSTPTSRGSPSVSRLELAGVRAATAPPAAAGSLLVSRFTVRSWLRVIRGEQVDAIGTLADASSAVNDALRAAADRPGCPAAPNPVGSRTRRRTRRWRSPPGRPHHVGRRLPFTVPPRCLVGATDSSASPSAARSRSASRAGNSMTKRAPG